MTFLLDNTRKEYIQLFIDKIFESVSQTDPLKLKNFVSLLKEDRNKYMWLNNVFLNFNRNYNDVLAIVYLSDLKIYMKESNLLNFGQLNQFN